jgi:peptidoglycan/LPS O-acetylase OafA/YrhL
MKRYHSLDIVRGLAALSVLLTHWGGWTVSFADDTTSQIIGFWQKAFGFLLWGGGGIHPGVIIFIVLSGFCIHLPQAMAPDKLNKAGFWRIFILRRSSRIMPVFWIALFLGLISVWLIGTEYTGEKGQVVNGDVFFSIFGIAEIARFFGVTALYPGNGPLSTVAVEMLLYASYPLFLFIHKRYGFAALLGFSLLMYSSIVWARLLGVEPSYLHGTWFEFVIYWIIGAVSAGVFAKGSIKNNYAVVKLALHVGVGYLCYLGLITFVQIKGFHVVTSLLLALLTGGVLISLLTLESKLSQQQTRIAAVMALLGGRSYSLYVVHTPVIFTTLWFLSAHTTLPIFSYPLLTLMVVLIATELMFRFVEQPSHQYARHWRQQKGTHSG